jgi:hypothetical protein
LIHDLELKFYCSAVPIAFIFVVMFVPIVRIAAIATTAINAAIKAYSIAVAPD